MDDALAKRRFALIGLVRLAGLLVLMAGLYLALGRPAQAPWAGYALVVIGTAGTFVAPKWLARRWRTPKP